MDLTSRVEDFFDTYLKEMRYLRNFTEASLTNCKYIFLRWTRLVGGMPTKDKLPQFIIKMRESGLSVTTCNITIRTFNSFLVWLAERGTIEPMRMKLLPEEKKKMRVLGDDDIKIRVVAMIRINQLT